MQASIHTQVSESVPNYVFVHQNYSPEQITCNPCGRRLERTALCFIYIIVSKNNRNIRQAASTRHSHLILNLRGLVNQNRVGQTTYQTMQL